MIKTQASTCFAYKEGVAFQSCESYRRVAPSFFAIFTLWEITPSIAISLWLNLDHMRKAQLELGLPLRNNNYLGSSISHHEHECSANLGTYIFETRPLFVRLPLDFAPDQTFSFPDYKRQYFPHRSHSHGPRSQWPHSHGRLLPEPDGGVTSFLRSPSPHERASQLDSLWCKLSGRVPEAVSSHAMIPDSNNFWGKHYGSIRHWSGEHLGLPVWR